MLKMILIALLKSVRLEVRVEDGSIFIALWYKESEVFAWSHELVPGVKVKHYIPVSKGRIRS